jgi:uncharacterized membrane protein YqjE
MIHPLFTRLATQPGLFAEHLGAYAELASAEAGQLGRRWLHRGVLLLVALALGALALGLVGMAMLLAAVVPLASMPAPWALWVVPAVPALAAALCTWLARGTTADTAFPLLRLQLDADAQLMREVEAP